MEELRVIRSYVGNSDSHVAVRHLAKLDQLFYRGAHDLRWDGESHPRERARRGDQERVDPYHFAACIHQRSARVSLVNGRIRLNELSRFAGIIGGWIRTIQRADNAASHRKAESKRVAERQDGLALVQLRRIPPGRVG